MVKKEDAALPSVPVLPLAVIIENWQLLVSVVLSEHIWIPFLSESSCLPASALASSPQPLSALHQIVMGAESEGGWHWGHLPVLHSSLECLSIQHMGNLKGPHCVLMEGLHTVGQLSFLPTAAYGGQGLAQSS